jgi:hypothetical protein
MVGIWSTMGMKPLWTLFFIYLFIFPTRDNWVVLFASRGNNGSVACHLDKERDSCGCGKRNNSGTG